MKFWVHYFQSSYPPVSVPIVISIRKMHIKYWPWTAKENYELASEDCTFLFQTKSSQKVPAPPNNNSTPTSHSKSRYRSILLLALRNEKINCCCYFSVALHSTSHRSHELIIRCQGVVVGHALRVQEIYIKGKHSVLILEPNTFRRHSTR